MRIVPPEELRSNIAVQLAVLEPYVKRATGLTQQIAREKLLDRIMGALAGTIVVKPDPDLSHPRQQVPGRFGVTEPHPFPKLLPKA